MSKVVVHAFSLSLDGIGAGPDQSLQNPLGVLGPELMGWFFPTKTFRTTLGGMSDGETGIDDKLAAQGLANKGAWILGRNMFGPVRGTWPDEDWRGWWGEEPPYHCPVFVLTHHARAPLTMKGGTVFHFVTGGIHQALEMAKAAAGNKDVRIGGGPSTVRQYVQAGLVDELHFAVRPLLMGRGEAMFQGMDWEALGYQVAESIPGERATHVIIRKK